MIRNSAVKLSCISGVHGVRASAKMSTTAEKATVAHNSSPEKRNLIFQDVGNNGIVILNRPEALNAFDRPMIREFYSVLEKWEPKKRLVIIKSAGNKVFGAGGDVKTAVLLLKDSENGTENLKGETALAFQEMYRVHYLISTYTKPYIAIMNGMTLGGSTGLCVHGKYRIATENTLYALPENRIGLFPDAGNTYFLPRLQNRLGHFLGMTGYRLRGLDVLFAGIATHYIPSNKLQTVTEELLSENSNIDAVLKPYSPENIKQEFSLAPYMDLISRCFAEPTIEEIIKRLNEDRSDFSQKLVELMNKSSPTSLKVTKKAFEENNNKNLAECLKIEYRLSCRCFVKNSDFAEGVRATLIEKDQKPKWNPETLGEVSDEYIKKRFDPLPPEFELSFSKL